MGKFENTMNMLLDTYHKPTTCEKCGGRMIFHGCGEYVCENCKNVEYDDYGKVRNYIETHGNATITDTAEATGVKTEVIKDLIKNMRISKG